MHCPHCGRLMTREGRVAWRCCGNVLVFELLFWLLFMAVFTFGFPGIAAVAAAYILWSAANWRKIRYRCMDCGHSETVAE